MFEECFSMIEIAPLVDYNAETPQIADDRLFDELSSILLSALEDALDDLEGPVVYPVH